MSKMSGLARDGVPATTPLDCHVHVEIQGFSFLLLFLVLYKLFYHTFYQVMSSPAKLGTTKCNVALLQQRMIHHQPSTINQYQNTKCYLILFSCGWNHNFILTMICPASSSSDESCSSILLACSKGLIRNRCLVKTYSARRTQRCEKKTLEDRLEAFTTLVLWHLPYVTGSCIFLMLLQSFTCADHLVTIG